MPTPAQIAEQVANERNAIKCGIEKLYKNTNKLETREYASASVYGVTSIKAAQEHVTTAILNTFKTRVLQGKNGVAFKDVATYLGQFNNEDDATILANITLKRVFDKVRTRP
jgi:hypothetical protein